MWETGGKRESGENFLPTHLLHQTHHRPNSSPTMSKVKGTLSIKRLTVEYTPAAYEQLVVKKLYESFLEAP
jgi:hypothetical protein